MPYISNRDDARNFVTCKPLELGSNMQLVISVVSELSEK